MRKNLKPKAMQLGVLERKVRFHLNIVWLKETFGCSIIASLLLCVWKILLSYNRAAAMEQQTFLWAFLIFNTTLAT